MIMSSGTETQSHWPETQFVTLDELKEEIAVAYLGEWKQQEVTLTPWQKDALLCDTSDTIDIALFPWYDEMDIKMLADELATLNDTPQDKLDEIHACIADGVESAFPLVVRKEKEFKKIDMELSTLKTQLTNITTKTKQLRQDIYDEGTTNVANRKKNIDEAKIKGITLSVSDTKDILTPKIPPIEEKEGIEKETKYYFPVQWYDKVTQGVHGDYYDANWAFHSAHYGFDIDTKNDNPHPSVLAACTWTVVNIGGVRESRYGSGYSGYGNHIVLQVGKYLVMYAHLLYKPIFADHTEIKAGTAIGKVWSTGESTWNHLHFEVREWTDRKTASFVNPNVAFPDVRTPKAIAASSNLSADAKK